MGFLENIGATCPPPGVSNNPFSSGLGGLGGFLGGVAERTCRAAQPRQQQMPVNINWRRYEKLSEPDPLKTDKVTLQRTPIRFIDQLRIEIDDWIKLN